MDRCIIKAIKNFSNTQITIQMPKNKINKNCINHCHYKQTIVSHMKN